MDDRLRSMPLCLRCLPGRREATEEAEGQRDVTEADTAEEEGAMRDGGVMVVVQVGLEVDGDRVTGGQDDDVITDGVSVILQCCNKCFSLLINAFIVLPVSAYSSV